MVMMVVVAVDAILFMFHDSIASLPLFNLTSPLSPSSGGGTDFGGVRCGDLREDTDGERRHLLPHLPRARLPGWRVRWPRLLLRTGE